MKYSNTLDRLASLGGDKWHVYHLAKDMIADGKDVIELAIGEPDIPTPATLVEGVCTALRDGRTGYSTGPGEIKLRQALASRYSRSSKRDISPDQILCFPGTQTALFAVVSGVAGTGDEILVGDPMYATYESVIAASGAKLVPVPLLPENDFRMAAADIAARITPQTTAIFVNTPHNPTGAILTPEDIVAIGNLARKHGLWLLVDEVYEEVVFEGRTFTSPLTYSDFADHVIVVSSISKSHAAPGFRSGWCVASEEFCRHLLPLSEAMLFGNQPFIADATAAAVSIPSTTAAVIAKQFAARSDMLLQRLHEQTSLRVHQADAGMFALIDVSSTGMNGDEYAMDLLKTAGVAVMPGSSFGTSLSNWVRISLTKNDVLFEEGCKRIIEHANRG